MLDHKSETPYFHSVRKTVQFRGWQEAQNRPFRFLSTSISHDLPLFRYAKFADPESPAFSPHELQAVEAPEKKHHHWELRDADGWKLWNMKSSFPTGDVQRLWGFFEYRLYPGAKMG